MPGQLCVATITAIPSIYSESHIREHNYSSDEHVTADATILDGLSATRK